MTRQEELVEATLALVAGRADAEVYADVGTSSLTRFANSFIHQNVSEDAAEVTLKVAVDGRVSSSTTTDTTPEGLAAFVDAVIDTAAQQPIDDKWPGIGDATEQIAVDHWDEATADADPVDRAMAVKAFVDEGEGMLAAGFCQTESRGHAFGNSNGARANGRFTTAVIDGIHQTPTSAGSGHAAGSKIGALDAAAVGVMAARRSRDSANPFDAKPGDYEVVLSPECVATIGIFLNAYGFNAKTAEEGMSFAELGSHQFDDSVNIWDDATDPRALYVPFDIQGTPKKRTELVSDGVTRSLLHNRRTAGKAGVASTGHAVPGGDVFGPFAMNMFIGGGDSSVDALIATVERGIYVSAFNYCRVLDPKSLVVTGLTRNGTFMIENGKITDAVTNMRFTQSFISALGPGNVVGIGDDARFADSEFGPLLVHAPSMRLASWNFTGGADG
jgi:predicted Zn-dependent protease